MRRKQGKKKKTRKKEEKRGEKKRRKKKRFFLKTRTRLPLKSDAWGLKNVFPPTRRVIVSLYARSLREWKSDLRCPGFLSRNFCTPYLAILNFAQFFRISHSFLIAFSCFSRFFASVFGFSHSFLIAFWSKNRKNFLALRARKYEKAMQINAFLCVFVLSVVRSVVWESWPQLGGSWLILFVGLPLRLARRKDAPS